MTPISFMLTPMTTPFSVTPPTSAITLPLAPGLTVLPVILLLVFSVAVLWIATRGNRSVADAEDTCHICGATRADFEQPYELIAFEICQAQQPRSAQQCRLRIVPQP